MHDMLIGISAIVGTIISYLSATWLYKRFYTPLLLPVFIATVLVVVVLLLSNTTYQTYMMGAKWIDAFLGPAVVALAYPLYQNRKVLGRFVIPIGCGTLTGSFLGITSGVVFAKVIGYEKEIVYSLAPKSVTTPVAMDISHTLTGISSLAAVFVMIAGISGAMLSTIIFKWFHLDHFVARGVALGSASHAIGTSRSLENSLEEGSISTIAMILCAVFVSIMAPFLVSLFI
jgi:predicted murein hydrolase (TIGR00659 family)